MIAARAERNWDEEDYLGLLHEIIDRGVEKTDRTGVGTYSLFGRQLRFDLRKGFPLLTSKKMFTRGIFGELCWLISGDTNIKYLLDNDIHIWDEWADEKGDLGPVYGKQWRSWDTPLGEHVDQLMDAVDMLIEQPDSRRIIVNAWNPVDVPFQALPPCHMMFQFEVHDEPFNGPTLSCSMYMRSADAFLGVPFNIASYAALTHVIARATGLQVGDLIISFGDVHIYKNHLEQVREQISRLPKAFPKLELNEGLPKDRDLINMELSIHDFKVVGYESHPPIKGEVAV